MAVPDKHRGWSGFIVKEMTMLLDPMMMLIGSHARRLRRGAFDRQ
jgi:hypothetical protein